MLVLSRKKSQRIVLPSLGVTVEVLEIRGGRVRIGIEAPAEIAVYRQEIVEDTGACRHAPPVPGTVGCIGTYPAALV
jgi:carbon storage regulator